MTRSNRQLQAPACHRCGQTMNFQAVQNAGEKRMDVFQCSRCNTLEALEERSGNLDCRQYGRTDQCSESSRSRTTSGATSA